MCNQLFFIEREIVGFPFEERCIAAEPGKAGSGRSVVMGRTQQGTSKVRFGEGCVLSERTVAVPDPYLEDGRLEVSNNRAKRSIKPFVMDRKNFLFANGAQGSAIITGFYERYGWKFLCMVQGDGEPEMIKMYSYNL